MALAAVRQSAYVRASHGIGDRLDAASRAVDGHFLRIGAILGDAVGGLGKLVASLDQIQVTLDPQMIAATTGELQAAARDLLALPERHADRARATRRLAASAERLSLGIDDMRRTLAYLRVFAINIKITAGGIASAGGEFGDFAQEIGECIELGRKRLDAFEAALAALRGDFKAAFAQEQGLADQCGGLIPTVPDGLIANAEAMVAHHHGVGKVAGEVALLVRAVQKKTSMALGALQIGDITRQRIEHVSEALQMLSEVEGLSDDQAARMAAFVHNLLTAQLRAAGDDFYRDVGQIGASMGGIAGDAQEILRLRDLALGRSKGEEKGILRQVETHVGQALNLVGAMAQADRQALAMGVSVSAAAADLSAQITELRTIKIDVQFMALNTTLKCGRLGDAGKPLAVIATELRLHAGHMDTSAQAALTALDALTQDAGQISRADAAETAGFAEQVGEHLTGVAGRLRKAGDQVDADLADVAREGDRVVDGLRRASAQMNFQREIGAILEAAADDLEAQAGASPPSTSDIAGPLGELLAKIAKRYTMAQERDVHHDLAGDFSQDPVAAEPAPVSAEAELEDILF